jgi:hypothetical protein
LVNNRERRGGLSSVSSRATMAMAEFSHQRRKEKEEWHLGSYSRRGAGGAQGSQP